MNYFYKFLEVKLLFSSSRENSSRRLGSLAGLMNFSVETYKLLDLEKSCFRFSKHSFMGSLIILNMVEYQVKSGFFILTSQRCLGCNDRYERGGTYLR